MYEETFDYIKSSDQFLLVLVLVWNDCDAGISPSRHSPHIRYGLELSKKEEKLEVHLV
jgi:hypothetical protein